MSAKEHTNVFWGSSLVSDQTGPLPASRLDQEPVSVWQEPVSVWQEPVSVWQEPVSVWQEPVSVWQEPVSVWQEPVSEGACPE